MILYCNVSLHPLKPLQHIQACRELQGDSTHAKGGSWIEQLLKKGGFETSCATEENDRYFLQHV